MTSNGPMTYQQAQKQVVEMRKAGQTYGKIAEHLQRIGYKSEKTKGPVTPLTVRHMATRYEEDQKAIKARDGNFNRDESATEPYLVKNLGKKSFKAALVSKEGQEDKPMLVTNGHSSLQRGIEQIMRLESFTNDIKDELILVLAKSKWEERERNKASSRG